MKRALLIVDHGSRRGAANESLHEIAALIRRLAPELIVHAAHMELAEPDIPTGIAACVADGADEVIVHPFMLGPGRHAAEDIPRLVREAVAAHPGVDVHVTAPLGVHEKLAEIVLERAGLFPTNAP